MRKSQYHFHFILLFLSGLFLFEDAQASTQLLTFNTALELIMSRSTNAAIEQSTLDLIRARNLPAKLAFLPTLSFDGKQPILGTSSFLYPVQQLELSSQLNLFKFGADLSGLHAAIADEGSQRSNLAATLLSVEESGISALISEIQKQKEVRVHSEIVKNRAEIFRIAEQSYKAGYLPIQEVEKLTVDLENARARLTDAETQEIEARMTLENLLGRSDIEEEWPWREDFTQGLRTQVASQQFELSHRPDWAAAKTKLEAETHRVSQNQRLLLPSIDTYFTYGVYSGYFGALTGWTGSVSLTWPLFDHLSNYSKAAVQSQTRAVAESQLEQVARNARSNWETSRLGFQKYLQSAIRRDRTLMISRKLYQDNLRRFNIGRITANDLAVDQARMFDSELYAIQGWAAVHISYTKLCHSLGIQVKDCRGTSQ